MSQEHFYEVNIDWKGRPDRQTTVTCIEQNNRMRSAVRIPRLYSGYLVAGTIYLQPPSIAAL